MGSACSIEQVQLQENNCFIACDFVDCNDRFCDIFIL